MIGTPLLAVVMKKNGEEKNRFGVVVSKRISKKAVERNRIRRMVFEAIRKKKCQLKNEGTILVVLVKRAIIGQKCEKVEAEIGGIFERINEKDCIKTTDNL